MIKAPGYFSKFCALLVLESDWPFDSNNCFNFLIFFYSINAAESERLGNFVNDLQIIYKQYSQDS